MQHDCPCRILDPVILGRHILRAQLLTKDGHPGPIALLRFYCDLSGNACPGTVLLTGEKICGQQEPSVAAAFR